MKKVLIITQSFPPINNIAARRYGEMAPYLFKHGWEPIILTTNSHGTLPVNVPEKNIIRYGKHPYNSSEVTNDTNHRKKNMLRYLKRNLGFNLKAFDRSYFDWYQTMKKGNVVKERQINLIIATYGPSASLYLGKYLSSKLNLPWIADFRDLGALYEDTNFKQNIYSRVFDKLIEKRLISTASAITSIGNTLTQILGDHYNKPSYSIFNGWDINNENENITRSKKDYIYYAGRLYSHRMESLIMLISSLKNVNYSFTFRSLGPTYLNEQLLEFAKQEGVSDKVNILEPADQYVVYKESQQSVANLVLEDLDKTVYWKKGTLTGKFLGLLPLNPPILAIARCDSEIGEILEETSKGKLCSSIGDIEHFFISLNEESYTVNNKIHKYSKQKQAEELSNVFNEVLNRNENK